ncbi:hypothetical protein Nmel_017878 [Mimus melanotis]
MPLKSLKAAGLFAGLRTDLLMSAGSSSLPDLPSAPYPTPGSCFSSGMVLVGFFLLASPAESPLGCKLLPEGSGQELGLL